MESIASLIAIDDTARFRNDVQLSLYDDPAENLALLKSYIFTVAAPKSTGAAATHIASVTLLEHLINSFLGIIPSQNADNRFVAIANYGHGKSHLALALTNYFAKATASEEVALVLDKLEHAINEPARAAKFRTFKQNRGEFLVVRLRGDIPSTLSEQFYAGLERALREHQATAEVVPPIWHTTAEAVLVKLTDDELTRANASLARYGTDAANLIADVHVRKDVRTLCIEALTAAKGMVPNLEAQSSLKDTVNWIVKTLCGEGKPLGGLLVLFDEFSLFVNRYARQGVSGELQDLLNGISDHNRHVVFLAFAQHDPDTVADNASVSNHALKSLKHELTRIPKKLAIYSLMESVIDAYLRQRDYAWGEFAKVPVVKTALEWASHVAYQAFAPRYLNELRWVLEDFDKTVTKGCFPLHPLTTALLCNLRFGGGDGMSDPRTVLGFVLQHLQEKLAAPLLLDNRAINWVTPVELVEYFEQRISPEVYAQYVSARRNLTHEATDMQRSVLKALYLYAAAELSLSPRDQVDFLVEAIGAGRETVNAGRQRVVDALTALATASVIRHDGVSRVYSFWPATVNFAGLEQLVNEKLDKTSLTAAALQKLNARLGEFGYSELRVDVPWGHPQDWAPTQTIIARNFFDVNTIKALAHPYQISGGKIEEGERGAVLWLAADNEDDVQWFRDHAADLLDQALPKDMPHPAIAILPSEPTPGLFLALRRTLVLQGLTPTERAKGGADAFEHMSRQATQTLRDELGRLLGDRSHYVAAVRPNGCFVAPVALRSAISTLPSFSLQKVLDTAYRTAYRHAPKQFFPQYKINNTNLRNAVKQVADILFAATPATLGVALNSNPVAGAVRDKILIYAWGLLTPQCAVKQPSDLSLRYGWDYLDRTFAPGRAEERLAKPLLTLLNPPYGYDYNTLTLLFASWYAYHHHDLVIFAQGHVMGAVFLQSLLAKGPKDFLQAICGVQAVSLVRRDPGETRQQIKALIDTQEFTVAAAEETLTALTAFEADERNHAQEREDARAKAEQITTALTAAQQYAKSAKEIGQLQTTSTAQTLAGTLTSLGDLPRLTLVKTDAPTLLALRDALMARLKVVVGTQCARLERPADTSQVSLNRSQLNALRTAVDSAELPDLVARVKEALTTLDQQAEVQRRRLQEEGYLQRIRAVSLASSLPALSEAKSELMGLQIESPDIAQERDKTVAALEKVIAELKRFATDLPARCAGVNCRQSVDQLRDAIMQRQARFIGSAHAQRLSVSLGRMDELRAFFNELDDFKRQLPQSHLDVERLRRRHAAVVNQYQGKLSEVQCGLLEDAQRDIDSHVAKSEESARQWLKRLAELARDGMNPTQVAQQLAKLPTFFPDDLQASLQALQTETQARIDSDAILRVEQAFRQIRDHGKQEECLERLSKILHTSTTKAEIEQ